MGKEWRGARIQPYKKVWKGARIYKKESRASSRCCYEALPDLSPMLERGRRKRLPLASNTQMRNAKRSTSGCPVRDLPGAAR